VTADWDTQHRVPQRDPDRGSWIRRNPLVIIAVIAIVVIGAIVLGGGSRPEEQGQQFPSLVSRVRGPGTRVWVELTPSNGQVREGWPPPMISRGELVCFGFGRLDFERPTRPTLARCVDAANIPDLPANGLVSLIMVEAGTDTWYLLAAGADVDSVTLTDRNGAAVDAERIHVDDELIALRLGRAVELSELSWIVGRTRMLCAPSPDAARTAEFCPRDTSRSD
jgi:hypothetical protein